MDSAPSASAQPAPIPFHLWRRRLQRRVRSAFSAASGARTKWDAASEDGLRAATGVVTRLVQLKQLPGKDVGALAHMDGLKEMAALKMTRLMLEDLSTLHRSLDGLVAAVDSLGPALLPICPPAHIPPPPEAPESATLCLNGDTYSLRRVAAAQQAASLPPCEPSSLSPSPFGPLVSPFGPLVSPSPVYSSPSTAALGASDSWQEAWGEAGLYPDAAVFTTLPLKAFERWAVEVAGMYQKELLVKRLIVSSLRAAVNLHNPAPHSTTSSTLNIPPLRLPCNDLQPAGAESSAAATVEASSEATAAVTASLTERDAPGGSAAASAMAESDGDGARPTESAGEAAVGTATATVAATSAAQGATAGSQGLGHLGRGEANGVWGWREHGRVDGCGWDEVKQQLEQSGLLETPPTPQQLQVCLVSWLVEMHIDARQLKTIFASVDEEVKSVGAL